VQRLHSFLPKKAETIYLVCLVCLTPIEHPKAAPSELGKKKAFHPDEINFGFHGARGLNPVQRGTAG